MGQTTHKFLLFENILALQFIGSKMNHAEFTLIQSEVGYNYFCTIYKQGSLIS